MLSTADAVAYLARFGIRTSRRKIDMLRQSGALKSTEALGRIKYLFHRADLIAAFTKDHRPPCINFSDAKRAATTTCAAPSRDSLFLKALAQATAPQRMRLGSGAKAKSSRATPMARPPR
jgi:hypothetical protein